MRKVLSCLNPKFFKKPKGFKPAYGILTMLLFALSFHAKSQSPTAPALGFNVFLEKGATLINNETEGPVAMGGDLTLSQNSYQVSTNYIGTFKVNNVPVTLVIGGKVNFNGGNGLSVNQNGYVKIGECGTSKTWYTDQNNAYSPIRITPGTDYNGSPRINLQANSQTLGVSAISNPVCQGNLIDFAVAFTTMKATSASISACTDNTNLTNSNGNPIAHTGLPNQVKLNLNTGINTLNLAGSDMNNVTDFIYNNKPDANHILVINVNASGTFNWSVYNSGGIGFQDCPYILYNFYNTTTLNIVGNGAVEGTVFAPYADIVKTSNQANIEGQIIAQSYIHNGGENHYPPFTTSIPGCGNVCNVTSTETHVNVSLFSGNNGSIDITVSGGTSPYTYLWNDGVTTEDRTNLFAGTYSVTITDKNGCSTDKTIIITQPVGSCTGFKTYTQGGWGAKANGNNPGVYRDANFAAAFPSGLTMGCAGGNKLILTSAKAVEDFLPSGSTPSLLPAGTLTNPGSSYSNVLAGQLVTAVLNVGFDLYDANFSSNAIHTGDLTIASGTFAGMTINQLIAEANSVIGGCTSTHTPSELNDALTSFNENYDNGTSDKGYTSCTPACNIAVSGTKVNITCHDASNGSINITVSGNNGSVTYLWNDGVTAEDRTGLSAGSYSVTATDAAGCHITSETFTVTEPDALGISGTPIDVTTIGGSNGSIDVTVTGGTTDYTYLWNDGATTEDRTNLPAGTYSVTVTDKNGCTIGKSFIIHEPDCNIAVSGTKVNITCHDAANGSINITVTGNNGSVTYLWNDGVTTEDRTGLSASTYSVTATDAAGCHVTSETFTITEPAALGISGTPLDVTTVGGSNGSIDVTVTGGTTTYTYLWNDGVTTEDRTGLPAGTYSVTVTDKNGCTIGKSFIIHEPTCNIAVSGTKVNIACHDAANGSINITVTGNNGSVTYLWNDGATTEDRSGLSAGSYSVTATDGAGCHITSETFTITEPDALGISGTPLDVTTVGGSNGSIDVTVTGGTTDYTYLWNDGVTTEDRTGLQAGTYSVTVTDKNGCTIGKSFIIHQPDCTIAVSGTVAKATCFGGNNGAINITVTGNTGAVTYLWNDGVTTEDRSNLVAGTYSVTVKDAAGCSVTSANFTVAQGKKIKITATVTAQTTKKVCDGTASLSATGGTAPYIFTWNDGYVGATRTGLCMGTYTITVTDKKGCPATCKVKILCAPVAAQSINGGIGESVAAGSTSFSVAVSPNPTKGLIKVSVNTEKTTTATITVYNLAGRALITSKINVVKGINMQELNLEKLAKGLYQVHVAADNSSKTFKIILE